MGGLRRGHETGSCGLKPRNDFPDGHVTGAIFPWLVEDIMNRSSQGIRVHFEKTAVRAATFDPATNSPANPTHTRPTQSARERMRF
jgi:hypothetical protein